MTVDYSSFSPSKMQSIILDAVTGVYGGSQTYNTLPQYVRDRADANYTLGGIAEAADNEYQKAKQSISGMSNFNDPRSINGDYAVSFQSSVTDKNRFQPVLFLSDSEVILPPQFHSSNFDGYLVGFGLLFRDLIPNNPAPISDNEYRRVTVFQNGRATLEGSIDGALGELTYAVLCLPDRVDIPGPVIANPQSSEGSVLSAQDPQSIISTANITADPENIVVLPGHLYIYGVPSGSWEGWTIRFLDGGNAGQDYLINQHLQFQDIGELDPTTFLVLESSITGGAVEGDWFMLAPPETEFFSSSDNAYRGMFVQSAATSPSDQGYFGQGLPRQVREIIKSDFDALSIPAKTTALVFDPFDNNGSEFEYPPIPNAFIGISNNYVELAQLAEYLGIYLDDLDPDVLHREQIAAAYDFHRIRGTKAGIELMCRLRGFESSVEELASTFTPDGGFIANNVVGSTLTVEHKQLPNEELPLNLNVPQSGQGVPREFVATPAGRDAARIPDSDINIYLERVNPLAVVSSVIFQRLSKQLKDLALPAHVNINILGLLQRFYNNAEVLCALETLLTHAPNIVVDVNEVVILQVIGNGAAYFDEPINTTSSLLLIMPARYDTTRSVNTYGTQTEGVPRWTIGTTRLA